MIETARLISGDETKINFGCGDRPMVGYVNIDKRIHTLQALPEEYSYAVGGPEVLDSFGPKSVDHIYTRHVLEHLHTDEVFAFLRGARKVLSLTGRLTVIVPNLLFHAQQLIDAHKMRNRGKLEYGMAGFYGWHRHNDDVHRWGWTPWTLHDLLVSEGFFPTVNIDDAHLMAEAT